MHKKIIIFSGTTEGKQLSELLSKAEINHTVSVASEYGKIVMDENPYLTIHIGKMDEKEIEQFLINDGYDICIDATHPFATLVTENVKMACEKAGCFYIRVLREEAERLASANYYDSLEKCILALNDSSGNLLVTTGSKEIAKVMNLASDELKERIYVRVLPSIESIRLCLNAGVLEKRIIAMQGPFTSEMNMAIIKQYQIKHLLTKDSGANGGLIEKIEGAISLGCKCHIIERPLEEEGYSVNEAYLMLLDKAGINVNLNTTKGEDNLKISLIGTGMGSRDCLTLKALDLIKEADLVFGAKRLLELADSKNSYDIYKAADIIPILEKNADIKKAVVLFSGDTGFFSGADSFIKAFNESQLKNSAKIEIVPGISTISYMASIFNENYNDSFIYSLHGRGNINELIDGVLHNRKTFVLLSNAEDIRNFGEKISYYEVKDSITLYACKNLSYKDEEVIKLSVNECKSFDEKGSLAAFIHNKRAVKKRLMNLHYDDAFNRDKIPMTKECVRHESIYRLELNKGDLVYDIGGGTGSVAIDIALLDPSLNVTTIEKKEEAVKLIRENALKLNALNLNVIKGDALEELKKLPTPNAVFIGGTGGKLKEIINELKARERIATINLVITAISFETINEVMTIIKANDFQNLRISQLTVANSKKAGDYNLLEGQNPVTIYSFKI